MLRTDWKSSLSAYCRVFISADTNCRNFWQWISLTRYTLKWMALVHEWRQWENQKLLYRFIGRITYLLTPWSRVPLEKLTDLQLVKKFPAFYGTRRFLTALTSARHLSLSPGEASRTHECYITAVFFYGEALLAPRPTPKLEDHPSSAARDCLFNLFAATLHTGGLSSIRNPRTRHAVLTGIHLHGIGRNSFD
jgi:hypothetical protein